MKKKTFVVDGKDMQIGCLTVQQVNDLMESLYQVSRKDTLQDLDDAGIEGSQRLQSLKELREESLLVSTLLKACFSLRGSMQVISKAFNDELPESFNSCDLNTLTAIAAHLIGFDLDDLEGQSSAEGNQDKKNQGSG